jgi:hypothetical protein
MIVSAATRMSRLSGCAVHKIISISLPQIENDLPNLIGHCSPCPNALRPLCLHNLKCVTPQIKLSDRTSVGVVSKTKKARHLLYLVIWPYIIFVLY